MITMDDIIRDGHPTLRKVAEEVSMPPSQEDIELLKSMHEYLINSQNPETAMKYQLRAGIGIAAPQINVSKRMIAIHAKDEKDQHHSYTLFNPKIISHSVEKAYLTSGEGCLSVDEAFPGFVTRYSKITVKAFDLQGKEVKLRLKGIMAIVFQHEIDHLNGVMFYDHINKKDPYYLPEHSIAVER